MTQRRRQLAHVLFAAAFLFAGVAVLLPASPTEARATDGSFTGSVTATRSFIDQNGVETQASSNQVTLNVAQTKDLRGRQEIHVTWDGAVPTGGVAGDPNSSEGRNQEYPFVLLQCRGVGGTVPKGQVAVTPETCWTQTAAERYLSAASHTPSWRMDAYAPPEDRAPVVGAPDPLPVECADISKPLTARWLPFRAASGEVYYGGPDPGVGCAPLAPESDSAESGGLPSNTTYGITGTNGHGETDFAVWTAAENASLGCSVEVSCSLVAVPIVGVSCDAWGTKLPAPQTRNNGDLLTEEQLTTADTTCRKTGAYQPGESRSSTTTDQAVRGNLWWSASNWRNRITVPLTFAATGAVCDAISKETPVQLMGSVVLNELTASWRPEFCTSKDLFTFTHVQQADSLARTLVNSGQIDGAFSSAPMPGGYARPVVQAPIAFGGFAIAFSIDDESRQRRESLNLNARLVAKLLSSSYPAVAVMRDNHPSIGGNPLNITLDPEFQALNPGIPQNSSLEAAAALQVFSANSDLIWALTSWIDADPEARAWLDGTPDPWGMKVNEFYRGLDLPVDNWPLRDDFVAPQWYQDQNACYKNSPTPFMQLIANPPNNLAAVALNLQYANSSVSTVCKFDGYDQTTLPLKQQGRQTVGYRFVLGVVSLSAARRYNLRTAALQTSSTSVAGQTYAVAGRTFVGPDTAGLQAAAKLLKADKTAATWGLDYSKLSTPEGRGAYPGAMPVYAVVPTQGLDEKVSTEMAKLLCYASADGQVPGLANGLLPPGYLPLTEENGLGAEHDYVLTAAAAVRKQAGDVPALDMTPPAADEVCDFSAPTTPKPSPTKSESATPATTPGPGVDPVVPAASVPTVDEPSTSPSDSATPVTDAPTMLTAGQQSEFGRVGVPGLLVFAIACALAGVLMRWFDPISKAVVSAGPTARKAAQRGRRRR
jgi:hypothetical protein